MSPEKSKCNNYKVKEDKKRKKLKKQLKGDLLNKVNLLFKYKIKEKNK